MKKTIYYTVNYEFYETYDIKELTGNVSLDVYCIDMTEGQPVVVKMFTVETTDQANYDHVIQDYLFDNGYAEHESEYEIILL